MIFVLAVDFCCSKLELFPRARVIGARRGDVLTSRATQQFVESRPALKHGRFRFGQARRGTPRILAKQYLASADRIAFSDQDVDDGLRGFGAEFDPVGGQFADDAMPVCIGTAASGKHGSRKQEAQGASGHDA
jgi:hypothetical protein